MLLIRHDKTNDLFWPLEYSIYYGVVLYQNFLLKQRYAFQTISVVPTSQIFEAIPHSVSILTIT